MTLARSNFVVDGTALNVPGVRWVTDEQKLHGAQNISIAQVTLPGRDGELPLPGSRTVGAAEWSLSMVVTGKDYADFLQNKADLERVLSPQQKLVTIDEQVKNAAGSVVRTLSASAMLTGAQVDAPWDSLSDGAQLTYTFRVPSGVWEEPYGATALVDGTTDFTPRVLASSVGGSAPQHSVVIILKMNQASANASSMNVDFQIRNPELEDAFIDFRHPTFPANKYGTVTIYPGDNYAVMSDGNGSNINVSNCLITGSQQFAIPPSGAYKIDQFFPDQVKSATIASRKAWY